MALEVRVGKKGRITIPISRRKKYNMHAGARLEVLETKEGILFKLKPKKVSVAK